jgi:exonuclease SbcD
MRVIHFADLHIGVELYGKPLPDRGWSSRMQDFLDAFDHLVAYAIEEGADAVIFGGDAYKSREPSQTHQREFARRIRRLSEAGIATFLLVGNHDLPNAEGRAHVLEIYRTLAVPNVYVGDASLFGEGRRPVVMETRAGPLQVAFLPWPQVSRWLANHPQAGAMTIDQQMHEVEAEMGRLIADEAAATDPEIPSVLAAHVSINDWLVRENAGSEKWMTVGTAPTMLKSALCEGSFDYIALGHHHNRLQLDLVTPAFYAGSMQPVDFGEEGQEKGFMVFDIDPRAGRGERLRGSGAPRFEPVPARRFVTVRARPRDADPTPETCAAIERASICDAIVRVEVHVTPEQERLFRRPEVQRLLQEAHFVAGIRTILPDEPAGGVLPAGVTPEVADPLEALDLYFRSKQYGDERRARLRKAAEDLMASSGVANA